MPEAEKQNSPSRSEERPSGVEEPRKRWRGGPKPGEGGRPSAWSAKADSLINLTCPAHVKSKLKIPDFKDVVDWIASNEDVFSALKDTDFRQMVKEEASKFTSETH